MAQAAKGPDHFTFRGPVFVFIVIDPFTEILIRGRPAVAVK
jgi:hypothetical protein